MTPSILVVENRTAILELLVSNVKDAGFLAVGARSAEEGLSLIRTIRPDLVILDRMLGSTCGIPLVDLLRHSAFARKLPLLILNDDGEDQMPADAWEASSFLSKPFSPSQLIASVRALLSRGASSAQGETLEIANLRLNLLTYQVSSDSASIQLRPTEFRLLAFFMAHPEGVYTRTQLLDKIWGSQVFISERAVDVQIRRLRAALEPYGHGQRLETVRGAGYRFTTSAAPMPPPDDKKPGSALRSPAHPSNCV